MVRLPITIAAALLSACGAGSSSSVLEPVSTAKTEPAPSAGAGTLAQAPPRSSADRRETRLISRMLHRVEVARTLEAKKAVPGVLLERPALIARVKEHVSRELPPEAIRNEGLALQLFGFVPTEFNYEAAEYRLLEDQLAGYYEPADGTMYMASDLGEEEADATLAHELVHALQDQRWDLQRRSQYRAGEGDRSEAVSALAEGDATSAMFDIMIERSAPGRGRTALDLPDEVFTQQIREGMDQGPGANAPRVMRSSLAAPYIYGTLFVHALRRRGGWAAVDRAWDDGPTTSEQIMHPEKWMAHEPPVTVGAPTFATLGDGWRIADEDSEGELGTRIAFEEWMDAKTAADTSAGWGGDRGVLIERGDRAAFAWRLRYDPGKVRDELTRQAFAAVLRGLDTTLGPPQLHDSSFVCRERADRGPIAVARSGADLVIVLGPARIAPGNWSSSGNCEQARRWVREITITP